MEDLGIDGMMILKCILGNSVGELWIGFIWIRIGTGGCFL
jgi:hypothetical protein